MKKKIEIHRLFQPLYERKFESVAFHGGRGSGKSHAVATYLILRGVSEPIRFLCTREIQRSIKESVHKLLTQKIAFLELESEYEITQSQIRGKNGTEFIFEGLHHNTDAIKSMEGLDGAWVEEAQTISAKSLDDLIPTVRKEGSVIIYTWNRRYTDDPVDDMFLGGNPPPNSSVTQVNWRDNPHFPEKLFNQMMWERERNYSKYLHIWEGHPVRNRDALVFRNWTVGDLDSEIPKNAVPLLGADWGYSKDPTVLIEAYIWDRTLYVANELWKVHLDIDDTPAFFAGTDWQSPPRWENRFGFAGLEAAKKGHRIVADSARPETIAYMKKRGFNIWGSKKGAGSVMDGIEFINSYDMVISRRCPHTIEEVQTYSFKTDPNDDSKILPVLEDDKNHTVDGLRYAVEDNRRNRPVISGFSFSKKYKQGIVR